ILLELIMLFKGFGLGLFVVLAAVLMLGTFASDYETFLKQHHDDPKSNVGNNYCNQMMQRRDMTRPRCKEVNTFIHETRNRIIDVCTDGGGVDIGNGFRNRFRVTTCKMIGKSTRPPCEYTENVSPRNIVISCKSLPMHYDEGQI
uniref:Angiogenin-like n=1 Tax=Ailuropoda melanoleuca TaxID=9646 RepID=A0A7N5KHK3_AILME